MHVCICASTYVAAPHTYAHIQQKTHTRTHTHCKCVCLWCTPRATHTRTMRTHTHTQHARATHAKHSNTRTCLRVRMQLPSVGTACKRMGALVGPRACPSAVPHTGRHRKSSMFVAFFERVGRCGSTPHPSTATLGFHGHATHTGALFPHVVSP